jgi:hypothetical protein
LFFPPAGVEYCDLPISGQVLDTVDYAGFIGRAKRGMLPVLDLDPVRRSAGATRPVPMLRNQAHEAHQAGMAEQIRENETVSVFACANPAGSRRSTLVEPLEVPSI